MLNYPAHVTKELAFDEVIRKGDNGPKVKRVQEWLKYNGFGTAIDADFGPATNACVINFQTAKGLPPTGEVDRQTWDALVNPLVQALAPMNFAPGTNFSEAVLRVAEQHLKKHPIEIGGNNRGPWVRVYVDGHEGPEWLWCAGFVTFVMKQACLELGQAMPIQGSFECDVLANQAKHAGRFVAGANVKAGTVPWSALGSAQIFLVRKTSSDWIHTGFSFGGSDSVFSTIEGNTDEGGSSNGFEVAKRTRALGQQMDFIKLL